MRFPAYTQLQWRSIAPGDRLRASTASGRSAKLPVTSSRPRSTRITKPTGKHNAPTTGGAPWARMTITSDVAYPSSMPASTPRKTIWGGESRAFCRPACRAAAIVSAAVTKSFMRPPQANVQQPPTPQHGQRSPQHSRRSSRHGQRSRSRAPACRASKPRTIRPERHERGIVRAFSRRLAHRHRAPFFQADNNVSPERRSDENVGRVNRRSRFSPVHPAFQGLDLIETV